jgi:hypothetical protein
MGKDDHNYPHSDTRFNLARTTAERGHYWTSADLVGGMLIDSGPPYAAWAAY